MFLEPKEEKIHNGSLFVGYDLGDDYSQISYYIYGQEEVETAATVVGTRQYNIPTVLARKKETNQWFYGKDAIKYSETEEVTLLTDLLTLACKEERVEADGESYDPAALLAIFLKRSLTLLSFVAPVDKIEAIMFTVEGLDERIVEVLAKAAVNLNLKTSRIFFQSHTESFYYFTLHQPPELWNYQVLACQHDGSRLKTYRLECNKRTTPIVVLIDEEVYDTLVIPEQDEPEEIKQDAYRLADDRFLEILKSQCEGRIISSAYLLGDGFKAEWNEKSLQFLCRNRRVFQGNNLFSRGACFSLMEKDTPSETGKKYVYLGKDRLKSNIGMNVVRQGKKSYFALLDAGENWYEAKKECEFLLEGEREIAFVVTPLTGKNAETKTVALKGANADRPPYMRCHMQISMRTSKTVHVKVSDMGFGELFPTSDAVWDEEFEVPE